VGTPGKPIKRPTVDFAALTNEEMARKAINVGVTTHAALIAEDLGDCASGHLRLSAREITNGTPGEWIELGQKTVGGSVGEAFAVNTEGKTKTGIAYCMDSEVAVGKFGLKVVADGDPANPKGWPGATFKRLELEIDDKKYVIEAVASFSGFQGDYDIVVAEATAGSYVRTWKQRLKARLGVN